MAKTKKVKEEKRMSKRISKETKSALDDFIKTTQELSNKLDCKITLRTPDGEEHILAETSPSTKQTNTNK